MKEARFTMISGMENMDKSIEADVSKIERAVEKLLAYRRRVWGLLLTLFIVSISYAVYRLYEMGIWEALFRELYDNIKTVIHH